MKVDEIVEKLSYYTEELPKEALREAIKKKEEMIPKLLEMLEYTKNNLENIYNSEDDFFGYMYAFFLLAEFKEKKAFPYLIYLLNKDINVVDYIMGEDFTEYLPRILASTYNGNDKALFSIIENDKFDEFIRSSTLQTFAILYLYDIKDRKFLVDYFKKLIKNKQAEDNSYLYQEILVETENLRLIELKKDVEKLFDVIEDKEELEDLKNVLNDENYVINRNIYPLKDHYDYIEDTIGIMEEWQCFRYKEDEKFEQSDDYKICEYIGNKRAENYYSKWDIGRNDLCPCQSGKKYKNCCISKNKFEELDNLCLIDEFICKAEWYLKRNERKKAHYLFRIAWFDVQNICKENKIKSIDEYDKKFEGFDCLLNWIQDYENLLEESDEEDKMYERLDLYDKAEKIFDLDKESELYWKERFLRGRANTEFRLGNEEKAEEIIRTYLKQKPTWVWGYIEMADWYKDKRDSKHYNLNKSIDILTSAEKIENIEDIATIYEKLEGIYLELKDKKMANKYDKKFQETCNI